VLFDQCGHHLLEVDGLVGGNLLHLLLQGIRRMISLVSVDFSSFASLGFIHFLYRTWYSFRFFSAVCMKNRDGARVHDKQQLLLLMIHSVGSRAGLLAFN